MDVTIVVIGRDEGPNVPRALRSAVRELSRAGTEGEVLFVDSGSLDGSAERARSVGIPTIELERGRASAAAARNAGLARARGTWVHFLDADMQFVPGWMARALRAARARQLDAVGGRIVEKCEGASIWTRVFGLDWDASGARGGEIGGAGLWRRSLLAKLGGFDERLPVGEDPDLCRRALAHGARLERLEQDMVVHELGLESVRDWWNRSLAVGRSAGLVARRHRVGSLLVSRFGSLLALAVASLAALWLAPQALSLVGLAALALVARRSFLDWRSGHPLPLACAHAVHVYASKIPQLFGATGAVASARAIGVPQ